MKRGITKCIPQFDDSLTEPKSACPPNNRSQSISHPLCLLPQSLELIKCNACRHDYGAVAFLQSCQQSHRFLEKQKTSLSVSQRLVNRKGIAQVSYILTTNGESASLGFNDPAPAAKASTNGSSDYGVPITTGSTI